MRAVYGDRFKTCPHKPVPFASLRTSLPRNDGNGKMKIGKHIKGLITQALREDIGYGDVTTRALIPRQLRVDAVIIAKQTGSIAGLDIAKAVFLQLDKDIKFKAFVQDGNKIKAGKKIARISGSARAILTAERTALNFLGHLSGIATLTRQFVNKVKPYKAKILDTRKTTPGLRVLEKYAVKCGGGHNHRMGLWDEVLIKENHIAVMSYELGVRSLKKIIDSVRNKHGKKVKIEIEVRNLKELKAALAGRPDIIMLDNMSLSIIKKAVKITNEFFKTPNLLEVSGGVNLANVRRIAKTGVDRISIGSLTHSAPALDVSLEIIYG